MLSVDITATPIHPLTNWVPGEGFVEGGWHELEETLTLSSVDTLGDDESINVLAYVANGDSIELGERLKRIIDYLTMRPELHLVDVVKDLEGNMLIQVARMARGYVDAIVTTMDSFNGPEHLRFVEEILEYYGVKLIVAGFYGV